MYKSFNLLGLRNPFYKVGSLNVPKYLLRLQFSRDTNTNSKLYSLVFMGGPCYKLGKQLFFARNCKDRYTGQYKNYDLGFTNDWKDVPYL